MVGELLYSLEIANGLLQLSQSMQQGGHYLHVLFLKARPLYNLGLKTQLYHIIGGSNKA